MLPDSPLWQCIMSGSFLLLIDFCELPKCVLKVCLRVHECSLWRVYVHACVGAHVHVHGRVMKIRSKSNIELVRLCADVIGIACAASDCIYWHL